MSGMIVEVDSFDCLASLDDHITQQALKEEVGLVTSSRLKKSQITLPNENLFDNEDRDGYPHPCSISSEVEQEEEEPSPYIMDNSLMPDPQNSLSNRVPKEFQSTDESPKDVNPSTFFSYSQKGGTTEDKQDAYSPSDLDIAVLKSYLSASESTIFEHSNAFISRYYDKIVEECESKPQRLMSSNDHSALQFILRMASMDSNTTEEKDDNLSTEDEIDASESLSELQVHNIMHATDEDQISVAVPDLENEREVVHEYFTNWRSIIENAQLRAVLIDLITLARAELELEEAEKST